MSNDVSWFGDNRKKSKEIVGSVKEGMVGVGKLLIVGLALGLGFRAFGAMSE